ncbi:hypothetical protein FF38_04582 [Lucilia cuprina]|uniref:Uncharacterized protein n=1 Tax=Lucilia cuprina TaxID=7375 RepID=A0A0L0BWA2_LUCCU|nr:hypothetical protein FF38_04582 [Lucilia cuprina]
MAPKEVRQALEEPLPMAMKKEGPELVIFFSTKQKKTQKKQINHTNKDYDLIHLNDCYDVYNTQGFLNRKYGDFQLLLYLTTQISRFSKCTSFSFDVGMQFVCVCNNISSTWTSTLCCRSHDNWISTPGRPHSQSAKDCQLNNRLYPPEVDTILFLV